MNVLTYIQSIMNTDANSTSYLSTKLSNSNLQIQLSAYNNNELPEIESALLIMVSSVLHPYS